MSTITHEGGATFSVRARRWATFITIAVVLALSVAEFINLLGRHTVGVEWYGVLVAGLAVAAGIFSLSLVFAKPRTLATLAVLTLWVVVGLGGLAGTYYHAVGVSPEYGPVDARPRPAAAPLIFTALALVGGAALFIGQRKGAGHNGR